MSGPLDDKDSRWVNEGAIGVEVRQGRTTDVIGTSVTRVLPTKGRRTIGAWCFVDLIIPPDAHDPDPLEIGPHPHIGLSTVTWLFQGEALHSDSLGTEQVIRPGQLNLMTSGRGIAHAELSTPDGVLGAQMWIALPEATRHGAPAFEHHATLPRLERSWGEATVLIGTYAEAASPARADTDLIGMDLVLAGSARLELRSDFEYGVIPIDRAVKVADDIVEPGWLGLVERGPEELSIEPSSPGARVLLVGGAPLGERIQMWWNFVARSKEEMTEAWRAWQLHDTDRFGPVPSKLARLDAPPPPWLRP
ncbi:MAG TPA: pirin family protein [Acidimicrobiia bacterium]|jgi:redox-sensitive bicupin YhaK (pirin superfamily)|nr:pirin family protein [Acidimicrobiia bacterium]